MVQVLAVDDNFYGRMAKKKFYIFLKNLNELSPCITFTYEPNKENTVFLDIKVSLRNGKVYTDVYVKPTDCDQYLHY